MDHHEKVRRTLAVVLYVGVDGHRKRMNREESRTQILELISSSLKLFEHRYDAFLTVRWIPSAFLNKTWTYESKMYNIRFIEIRGITE